MQQHDCNHHTSTFQQGRRPSRSFAIAKLARAQRVRRISRGVESTLQYDQGRGRRGAPGKVSRSGRGARDELLGWNSDTSTDDPGNANWNGRLSARHDSHRRRKGAKARPSVFRHATLLAGMGTVMSYSRGAHHRHIHVVAHTRGGHGVRNCRAGNRRVARANDQAVRTWHVPDGNQCVQAEGHEQQRCHQWATGLADCGLNVHALSLTDS